MKKSHIARPVPQDESPLRHLPLVDLLVDTRSELFELAMRSGLQVFAAMLEEDRTAICGRRYAHEPDQPASRAGTAPSEVVLGGRKVAIQRPRVRTAGGRSAAADVPDDGGDRSAESTGRRADARRRGDAAVRAQLGTARGRHAESRHQQERGQPALRGQDPCATRIVAGPSVGGPGAGGACCSTACMWASTASSWRWA